MESTKNTKMDYIFLLLVGSMYIYSLTRSIVTATILQFTPFGLFMTGVVTLGLLIFVFYNKFTRIGSVAFILLVAAFVYFTWDGDPRSQWPHFYDLVMMVRGYFPFRPELGRTAIWIISLFVSLGTVIFMFHRYNFYVLVGIGVVVYILSWFPGYSRDSASFLVMLFCLCLLLIRKMSRSASSLLIAAPICAVLVLATQRTMPPDDEFFVRRTWQDVMEGPLSGINDFIYELFNPMYFSFQHMGFGGPGGRLGGPIRPNNREVMRVESPGRVYLSGNVNNTFTGYSWINTLEYGELQTFGLTPGHFEFLEAAAGLIRDAYVRSNHSASTITNLRAQFPTDDFPFLDNRTFHGINIPEGQINRYYIVTYYVDTDELPMFRTSHRTRWYDFDLAEFHAELIRVYLATGFHGVHIIDIFHEYIEDSLYIHAYLPLHYLTVRIGQNRTGTIFRPNRSHRFWFDDGSYNYLPIAEMNPVGDFRAPRFMGRQTQYSHRFLHVDDRLTFVQEIMENSRAGLYAERAGFDEVWLAEVLRLDPAVIQNAVATFGMEHLLLETFEFMLDLMLDRGVAAGSPFYTHAHLVEFIDMLSAEVFTQYAATVRDNFLYVPEIVTQRVHDLTHEIIRYAENDFERIMLIREYLLQFPYTWEPAHVPRGVCFVDHFLFIGREGYCTYFASAMAIMSRIAGVPSRYVEGFMLPPTRQPATHIVTNRMAHAWAEVYFEGIGWVVIEATPPFYGAGYVAGGGGGVGELGYGWFEVSFCFDCGFERVCEWLGLECFCLCYCEMVWIDDWDIWREYTPADYTPPGPVLTPAGFFALMAGIAALIIAAFFGYLGFRRLQVDFMLKKVNKMPVNAQVQAYFWGILDLVSHCHHIQINPGETPQAYSHRVGKRFAFANQTIYMRELTDMYNKAKFSAAEITDAEFKTMKQSYFDMLAFMKSIRVKPHYVYLRYVEKVGKLVV